MTIPDVAFFEFEHYKSHSRLS